MQSILSNLSRAPLRPGLEGLASTAFTALIGLERSLQPLCPSFAPPLSTSPIPCWLRLQTSPVEVSPGVPPPSAPSLQGPTSMQAPPPSLGPHAVTPLSWAKVVGNSTQAPPRRINRTTRMCERRSGYAKVARRSSGQPRTAAESGITSSSSFTSIPLGRHGQTLSDDPPGTSGPSSPRGGKNGVETGSRFARVLRTARMDQQSSAEERTQALQQLLFAAPRSDPTAIDREPHRPGSEAAGRTGYFPSRELPELLRGSTQGAKGRLAPPAAGSLAEGLSPSSPGHLAYECHLSGDFATARHCSNI